MYLLVVGGGCRPQVHVNVVLLVLHVLVGMRMYLCCIYMYIAYIYKQFTNEYKHTDQY